MMNQSDPQCFKILPADTLRAQLSSHNNRETYYNLLPMRSAGGYLLPTGEVIVLSNDNYPSMQGLLYQNEGCFLSDLKSSHLPIENPSKNLYEYDQNGIKAINKSINSYQNYLNKLYGTRYDTINTVTIRDYLKKYILSISDHDDPMECLYITCVYAEYQRIKLNAKWAIVEQGGIYNPYFEPKLVTPDNKIFALIVP